MIRVSAGSALARVAYGALVDSMADIMKTGSFECFKPAASFGKLAKLNQIGGA